MLHVRPLVAAVLLLLCSLPAFSQTTVRDGSWSDNSVWLNGMPPRPDQVPVILHAVVLDVETSHPDLVIEQGGALLVARFRDSSLTLTCGGQGGLLNYGILDQGTTMSPLNAGIRHRLTFQMTPAQQDAFVGGPNFAPTDCGLWNFGRWDAHGAAVNRTWTRLAVTASAGATSVTVQGDASDWPIGGRFIVTQTRAPNDFWEGASNGVPWLRYSAIPSQTETRIVAAVSPYLDGQTTITFVEPLVYDHLGSPQTVTVDGQAHVLAFRGEVGLLTRTVVIETVIEGANMATDFDMLPPDIGTGRAERLRRKFAHTIVMPRSSGDGTTVAALGESGTADIRFVEFRHMGHLTVDGRPAIHVHRLGDNARGMVVRGNSFSQTALPMTFHESYGWLADENVFDDCSPTRGDPCLWPQTDPTSHLADFLVFRNLGSRPSNTGGGRDNALYWPGVSTSEAYVGNAAVCGTEILGTVATGRGHHWPESQTAQAGTQHRTFVGNDVHSCPIGYDSWQNRGRLDGHDIVGGKLWNNDYGFSLGAYNYFLPMFNMVYAGNLVGLSQHVKVAFVQDSLFLGRAGLLGAEPELRENEDRGIQFGNHPAVQWPDAASIYTRLTFGRLLPQFAGATTNGVLPGRLGIGIRRGYGACNPGEETVWNARYCSGQWPILAQNRYETGATPYWFGGPDTGPHPPESWPNANSAWRDYDRQLVLLRRDQATPTGLISAALVTPQTFLDASSGALATPFSALPQTLSFDLPGYGFSPARWSLAPLDAPPLKPSLSLVSVAGRVVTVRATFSADTTLRRIWVDHVPVCEAAGSDPLTCVVDLDGLSAYGDQHAPRRWAYVYAEARDGVNAPSGNDGTRCDSCAPWYPQRSYSDVLDLAPELFTASSPIPDPEPVPPTPEEQIAALQARVEQLEQQLATTAAAAAQAEADKAAALAQVTLLQARVAALEAEVQTLTAALDLSAAETTTLRAQLDALRGEVVKALALLQAALGQ